MELFFSLLEQIPSAFKEQYHEVIVVILFIGLIAFFAHKYRKWRWPNVISIAHLRKEQLQCMIGCSRRMRRVSTILPILTFIIAVYFFRDDNPPLKTFSWMYLILALPLLSMTVFQQYQKTITTISSFRRFVLLLPGILTNIAACLVWVAFFNSSIPLMVIFLAVYLLGALPAEWTIYLLTEEKESKSVIIYISEEQPIKVPYLDYRDTGDYICIRKRDSKTGDIVSIENIAKEQISKVEIVGIDS